MPQGFPGKDSSERILPEGITRIISPADECGDEVLQEQSFEENIEDNEDHYGGRRSCRWSRKE